MDYRNQKVNEAAPTGIKKLNPLVAIDQIMQHCLPKYFQKCRYLGLHANARKMKYENIIHKEIRYNNISIKTLFQILGLLLGINPNRCEDCGHDQHTVSIIKPNASWIYSWLPIPNRQRRSPMFYQHISALTEMLSSRWASYYSSPRF